MRRCWRCRVRRQFAGLSNSRLLKRAVHVLREARIAFEEWFEKDELLPPKVERAAMITFGIYLVLCIGIWTGVYFSNQRDADISTAAWPISARGIK